MTFTFHFTLIVAVEGQTSLQVLGDPCTNPVFIPLRSDPTLNHYSLLSPVDTSSCPWRTSDTKPIIFLFLQTAPFRISVCICSFLLISKHPRIGNDSIIYRLMLYDARKSIFELGGYDQRERKTVFINHVLSATLGLAWKYKAIKSRKLRFTGR